MGNIIIILLCLPLYVANSFSDKFVSAKSSNQCNNFYNWLKFLCCSVLVLPLMLLDKAECFGAGVVICGIMCGVMFAVSKTVILKGYEETSVSFMTLCHSAGMIIPCILGALIWNEPLEITAVLGILLVVVSVVLLKNSEGSKGKFSAYGVICGIIIFVTSGGVMVLQKLMGIYFATQSVNAFNFYSFITAFLLLSFFKGRGHAVKPILPAAVISAVSLSVISIIMTSLAALVPSAILFPLFNGLGIMLVCLGSALVFKEKLTAKKLVGLGLGVAGLCFINL